VVDLLSHFGLFQEGDRLLSKNAYSSLPSPR
jgi:hypothetical protein